MARSYRRWADTIVGDDSHRWDNFLPYFKKSLQFTLPDATKLTANATAEHDPASLGDNNGPLSVTFSSYVRAIACWVQKVMSGLDLQAESFWALRTSCERFRPRRKQETPRKLQICSANAAKNEPRSPLAVAG